MTLDLVSPDEQDGNCGWLLIAEGFAERQFMRLANAIRITQSQIPAPVLTQHGDMDDRCVFEYQQNAQEDGIVLHALAVARHLKSRVCLRGVPALARR